MALTALTKEMLKSILASAFAPLFFWSLVIAFAFSHTGTFRLKPKEPKQKAARVEEHRIRTEEAQVGGKLSSSTPAPVPGTTVFLTLLQSAAQFHQIQPIQAPRARPQTWPSFPCEQMTRPRERGSEQ
jgi:hypothetical protein